MKLDASELSTIHLALIHRENRLRDTYIPSARGEDAEKYTKEADELRELARKVCHMQIMEELGFEFPLTQTA